MVQHECARCGDQFWKIADAKGQAASWCAGCRRSYMRSYAIKRRSSTATLSDCVVCGVGLTGNQRKFCGTVCKNENAKASYATVRTSSVWVGVNAGSGRPQGRGWAVIRQHVIESNTTCRFCGGEVDKELKYPNRMSAVVDHIVPISEGGDIMSPDNLALAHLTCNSRAGNQRKQRRELERLAIARAALWMAEKLEAA